MLILLVFALLIAVVAVIFALQNTAPVTVSILFWNVTSSLAFVLLITLIAGIAVGFLAAAPTIVREKWVSRRHRKKLNELEANLAVHKAKLDEAQARITEQARPLPPPTATNGKAMEDDDTPEL